MLNDWLRTMLFCGGICALLLYLCPDGKIKGLMESGCVCLMLLSVLSPIRGTKLADYKDLTRYFQQEISQYEATDAILDSTVMEQVIKEEYASYILHEASGQGIPLERVSVELLRTEDGVWIPDALTYYSTYEIPASFQIQMTQMLGIPLERQYTYEY